MHEELQQATTARDGVHAGEAKDPTPHHSRAVAVYAVIGRVGFRERSSDDGCELPTSEDRVPDTPEPGR